MVLSIQTLATVHLVTSLPQTSLPTELYRAEHPWLRYGSAATS